MHNGWAVQTSVQRQPLWQSFRAPQVHRIVLASHRTAELMGTRNSPWCSFTKRCHPGAVTSLAAVDGIELAGIGGGLGL